MQINSVGAIDGAGLITALVVDLNAATGIGDTTPLALAATTLGSFDAVVTEVDDQHRLGRPVLVGTESIAESERLAGQLRDRGIRCAVLNAKNDELE